MNPLRCGKREDGDDPGVHLAGTGTPVADERAAVGAVEPRAPGYLRTLSPGGDGHDLGFAADAIDPRIEAIELGDSEVTADPGWR